MLHLRKGLFIFLFSFAWTQNVSANEIWSSRHRSENNFVTIQTRPFPNSPQEPNRQVHMCLFDQGQESCLDYPSQMTPVGEYLFARNVTGWADFFQRCREFDARNRFMITTQIASTLATGGLGAALGLGRGAIALSVASGVVTPTSSDYPSVPQDALNEAEEMMLFLIMGDRQGRVDSFQKMAKFKMAMDLCSTHLNTEVQQINHHQCMQGCHSSGEEQRAETPILETPNFQTLPPSMVSDPAAIEELRDYLQSVE